MRDILEKGVADAVTFPWGSIPLFGIDKVTKYHMEVPLYVTTFAFVFNKDKYDQMSAAQKKVIDDHCTNEWALKVASNWADFEHAGVGKLKADAAHEVYTHHAGATRRMEERGRSRWRRPGPTTSRRPAAIRDAIMKELQGRARQVQRGLLTCHGSTTAGQPRSRSIASSIVDRV